MFSKFLIAAAAWALVVANVWAARPVACQPCVPCQPLAVSSSDNGPQPHKRVTTQAAYESWVAWYRLHPEAKADAQVLRFKQLLMAADGDLFFLQGLDDASPQVRELSKQGLMQLPTERAYAELVARLDIPDDEVRQQSLEILAARAWIELASPFWWGMADSAELARLEAPLRGPAFSWGVPFGGLMRMALAGGGRSEPDDAELLENGIDSDTLALVVAIRELECPMGFSPYPFRDELDRLKRSLAAVERRRTSQRSARKLLELLDQTTQSSPLDEVTVEQLRQALALHVERASTADRGDTASSGESTRWPAYRLRIELERQVNARPNAAHGGLRQPDPMLTSGPAAPRIMAPPASIVRHSIGACGSCDEHPEIAGQFAADSFPAIWTNCLLTAPDSLAPGTYKLLVTFEPARHAPFGLDGARTRPEKVGAIVFRVQTAQDINAAPAPVNPLADNLPKDTTSWQVLLVAISDSAVTGDDLCIPSPSTLALRTQPRQWPADSFSMSASR